MTATITEIESELHTPSVVTGRRNALQVLGTDVSGVDSVEDVMETAKLTNWNVHLRRVQTVPTEPQVTMSLEHGVGEIPGSPSIAMPDTFAVIRNNPWDDGREQYIGAVGTRYTPMQNEEHASYLRSLVDASGAKLTDAGDYYKNGKQVFFTMKLPTSVLVGGRDLLDHYITIFSSHNGSLSTTPVISIVRPMCANMYNQTLAQAAAYVKARHTKNQDRKLSGVQKQLDIAWKGMQEFDQDAAKMMDRQIEDDQFWGIVNQLWVPNEESTRAQNNASQRNSELRTILRGETLEGIRGTAWGAFNVVTEYLNHGGNASPEVRAQRTLTSADNAKIANQARELLLAV